MIRRDLQPELLDPAVESARGDAENLRRPLSPPLRPLECHPHPGEVGPILVRQHGRGRRGGGGGGASGGGGGGGAGAGKGRAAPVAGPVVAWRPRGGGGGELHLPGELTREV